MARVNYTAAIETIIGKLAGSVFQNSYGGFQIRTRVSPRNPQSTLQQLRRGEFGYITQLWRSLSSAERASWSPSNPPGSSPFNFFVSANVNLSLINQNIAPAYITSSAPASMPVEFVYVDPSVFLIKADPALQIVPFQHSLLIFATSGKNPSKVFTNPSEFSPITSFAAGHDLSTSQDIVTAWQSTFGQLTQGLNICIKSALVNITNGNRTNTNPVCSIINEKQMYKRLFTNVIQASNNSGSPTQHFLQTLPPNTFKNLGDTLYVRYVGTHGASGTLYCQPRINSVGMGEVGDANFFGAGANAWTANLTIMWVATNVLQFTCYLIDDDTNFLVQNTDAGGFDANEAMEIFVNLQGQTAQFVTMQFGAVDILYV